MNRNNTALLLFLVLFTLFALATINNRSAIGDEFGTIWLAGLNNPSDIINIVHQNDVHPPTHYLILHYWGKIFGYNDFSMRLNSLVLLLLSFLVIWKLIPVLFQNIDNKSRIYIFIITVSTPSLFVIGSYARYYSLGLLISLLSIYFFILWYSNGKRKHLILYIFSTVLIFYLHYFLAFIVFSTESIYFLINHFKKKDKLFNSWLLSQLLIIIFFLPVFIWSAYPILSGQNNNLSGTAFEGLSGFIAIPLNLGGQIFTIFNGAIVFPWTFWITIPQLFIFIYILYLFSNKNGAAIKIQVLSLFIFPLSIIVILIPVILPFAGYFIGIFRAPFIIVFFWLFAGYLLSHDRQSKIKNIIIIIIFICNLYCIFVFGVNYFSMGQSPPVKEMGNYLKYIAPKKENTFVFEPWTHGWIKGHAITRYLSNNFSVGELKNKFGGIGIDSCKGLINNFNIKDIAIIQANRFSENTSDIKKWLISNGFKLQIKRDFTKQTDFDLWFKREIKNISFLKFNSDSPEKFIYTLYYYKRG